MDEILTNIDSRNFGKLCRWLAAEQKRRKEQEEKQYGSSLEKEDIQESTVVEETKKNNPFYPDYRSIRIGDIVCIKDNNNKPTDIKGVVIDFIGTDYIQVQLIGFVYKLNVERKQTELSI